MELWCGGAPAPHGLRPLAPCPAPPRPLGPTPPTPCPAPGPLHTHPRVGLFVCACLLVCYVLHVGTSSLWCGRYTRYCVYIIVNMSCRVLGLMGRKRKLCHESIRESLHAFKVANRSLHHFILAVVNDYIQP